MLQSRRLLTSIGSAPAMQFRDFRVLWLSSVFNATGFSGEMVALGWLMLELTGSPFMVGLGLGVRMVPFFFLGILAGAIADRVDRRSLMQVLSAGLAVVMGTLTVVIISGLLEVWHLLVAALAVGSMWALYQTCRQSFTHDIVGAGHLVSGLSFITLSMRVGAIGGSLAVGFLLDRPGAGAAYLMLSASYLLSAITLAFVDSRQEAVSSGGKSVWRNVAEFGQEVRRNPTLLALVVLTAAVEMLGFSHQALLPSLARDVFHVGSDGLGIMNASRSVGGIVAVLIMSSRSSLPRPGLTYLVAILLFGGGLALLGNVPTFALALAAIIVVNGMASLSDVLSQSLLQTAVPNELRGRAMGSWVLAVGTGPVGHLQIGGLASVVGVALALTTNGLALAALGVACLALLPRLRRQ